MSFSLEQLRHRGGRAPSLFLSNPETPPDPPIGGRGEGFDVARRLVSGCAAGAAGANWICPKGIRLCGSAT